MFEKTLEKFLCFKLNGLNHNKGLAMKDNLVVQHNDLVTASYAMTRHEQNLLLSCISQIDSRKRLDEGSIFSRLSKPEPVL